MQVLWHSGRRRRGIVVALAALIMIGVVNWIIFPLPKGKLHRPPSTFVYSREGRLLNCFASPDGFWRKPVKLDEIAPLMVKSVIAREDRWFYYHSGFNPISLMSAAIDNIRVGKFVRGGSTITMQIARMMEPKSRTIPGKIIEILRSVQLEVAYSKRELLEIYFNLVPYGGNIEGIGAAAYMYFDKKPCDLSTSEVAMFTAIPASPSDFRPDGASNQCLVRRNRVLQYLQKDGIISRPDCEQALKEEIPSNRVSPAVAAPHFCQSIARLIPNVPEVHSTIDARIQHACEQLAGSYHGSLTQKGINNLSLVVLSNESCELLAMVGSPIFDDVAHQGQVNGALAPRSPGSALKPFVYALGFDQGLISSALKIEDLPVNYSGYIPVNYDNEYHGIVSVNAALTQSLNVPAINLAAKIGIREVHEMLRRGGISTLDRKYFEYGLPLVLGSGEVTLLDLTALYSVLARGGTYIPVKISMGGTEIPSTRLFSSEASYLVTEILSELKRPDLPANWEFTRDMPQVAWKTGTSYGRKDAWAIGYNRDYTIGVWAGNFSAEGSVAIVGAEVAAPLMLDLFYQLGQGQESKWFKMPGGIGSRMVCAATGRVADEACQDKIVEHYIPAVSPADRCAVHKKIIIDRETGYQLCRYCSYGKKIEEKIIEDWPPKPAAWLSGKGMIGLIPAHNPRCKGTFGGESPIITSPEHKAIYLLRASTPLDYQKILFEASTPGDNRKLFWFLDGQLYSSCERNNRIFYAPERGTHSLICSDGYGRSSSIVFDVQ